MLFERTQILFRGDVENQRRASVDSAEGFGTRSDGGADRYKEEMTE